MNYKDYDEWNTKLCEKLCDQIIKQIDRSDEVDEDDIRCMIAEQAEANEEFQKLSLRERILGEQKVFSLIKKYMKEIPKHFVELLSNNNDKQCYLNEQSNQNKNNNGMGYNVHLKINDIINEINKENLIEDKLISLTQITVLEGNNIFKQITGQNCAFTPVKKHIDKNKFEEEQKKLREVYGDEGIYIPFNEEILNTIHKTNTRHQNRFSFGINDSLPN
jgi:hypothetical protein